MAELISLAEKLAQLAPAALFALLIILIVVGKFRLDREVKKAEEEAAEKEQEHEAAVAFREQLRQEALADRKASDIRVERLTTAIEESNKLTKLALGLMEKILNEVVKAGGRSHRA